MNIKQIVKIGVIAILFIFSYFEANASQNFCRELSAVVSSTKNPSKQLQKFLDFQWQYMLTEFPEYATYAGEPGHNDVWTDLSMAAILRRQVETKCQLKIISKIPSTKLKGEEKINYELARRALEIGDEGDAFEGDYLVLDQMGGVHQTLADILIAMPRANKSDYENMLARIEKYPILVEQNQALLAEGARRHVTSVKMFLERVPAQFDKLLTDKIEDSPFYKPFLDINSSLTVVDKKQIQQRAQQVLLDRVYPALKKFKNFVVSEYIPQARDSISIEDLPNGNAWYNYLIKVHTTTNKTANELHQLGLSEVSRITQEMQKIREKVKFKGDLKEFNRFLLADRQFYYQNKEDLLTGFRDIAKRIDPELPRFFKTLPELTYGVREMPEFKAKEAPGAYYEGGSMISGRAGYFTANTYDLAARPKWGMEALTLHESVPGHHLQISLAQELKGLPKFRTEGSFTAFVEGWALYCEGLGEELGFYKDPYSKYGQLSYEMWRAVRLVVDTGIHSRKWSRQQAIDYMMDHMPKSKLESEVEIDRYITWPGQALAYKVGQLKFLELRQRAEKELGEAFNIREFHDELLKHGALPLDILEKIMSDWISKQVSVLSQK